MPGEDTGSAARFRELLGAARTAVLRSCRIFINFPFPLVMVIGIGCALSLGLYGIARQREAERVAAHFHSQAAERFALIRRRLETYIHVAESLRALFVVSPNITTKVFGAFAREILATRNGISFLAWLPCVKHAERQRFERDAAGSGMSGFAIKSLAPHDALVPSPPRDHYFPVLLHEPFQEGITGFDFGSDPPRRAAMNEARETRRLTVTEPVTLLIVPEGDRAGILFVQPVFGNGGLNNSSCLNDDGLLGFVAVVVRLRTWFEEALAPLAREPIEIFLFDQHQPEGRQALYAHGNRGPAREVLPEAALHLSGVLEAGNRRWALLAVPTASYFTVHTSSQPLLLLGLGVLATAALAAYLVRSASRTAGIERLITERTAELDAANQRFSHFADHIRDAIWIASGDLSKVLYVNQAYEAIWGKSCDSLYREPASFFECVHAEDIPLVRNALAEQANGREVDLEYRIQVHDAGRWVRYRSFPWRISQGESLAVCICEDITDRKHAETQRLDDMEQQRRILVREVHHRIKNHLQSVAGLLRIQADENPRIRRMIDDAIAQVQSVATIHGLQGQSADDTVLLCDMVLAIRDLVAQLTHADLAIEVSRELEQPIHLTEEEAVPLALILNELMLNAVKHSPLIGEPRQVRIRLSGGDQVVQIRMVNPGTLPSHLDFRTGKGIGTGLSLVKGLTPAQGVQVTIENAPEGVVTTIHIAPPVIPASARPASI